MLLKLGNGLTRVLVLLELLAVLLLVLVLLAVLVARLICLCPLVRLSVSLTPTLTVLIIRLVFSLYVYARSACSSYCIPPGAILYFASRAVCLLLSISRVRAFRVRVCFFSANNFFQKMFAYYKLCNYICALTFVNYAY